MLKYTVYCFHQQLIVLDLEELFYGGLGKGE